MKLTDYLVTYGYCEEDANEMVMTYYKDGIPGIKRYMRDWDDDKHDYTGELIDNIEDWEIKENIVRKDNFDFIFFET